eukprot:2258091-Pyramimonas_sp.AAC.1
MAHRSRAHSALGHRIWIDGLSQRAPGSRTSVVEGVTACLGATCNKLAKWHLDVPPKSIVICSCHGDAKEIAQRLKVEGSTVRPQLQG